MTSLPGVLGMLISRSGEDFVDRPCSVLLASARLTVPEALDCPAFWSVLFQAVAPSSCFSIRPGSGHHSQYPYGTVPLVSCSSDLIVINSVEGSVTHLVV